MFGISRAPEINRPGLQWFNTPRALSLADLKGRIVILDFWTFCCINCFHVLPTLRRLEEAFPAEVAVIGIHSPKFAHERDPAQVAQAIARYDVHHPVAHDPRMELWHEYAVRAWPTLVFISPDGYVIGELAGEPHPDLLIEGVGDMIQQFRSRGELDPASLPPAPAPASSDGAALRFPGKIKPCPGRDGARLWAIADSGHNQVVVVADDGSELVRYGSGHAGLQDGDGAQAQFDGPEGLACDADFIYVADTRNHAIRRIDRASGRVETIAGTGVRGPALVHPGPASVYALASPWDVEIGNGVLFFANAGSHQIGALDLKDGTIRPVAGSGGENILDGRADEALLAQPSGLALDPSGRALFFADSETSSIRRLWLDGPGRVETIVGAGLFDFGHQNGPLAQARLQHPLGVTVAEGGRLFVADSYNGRVRVIDLERGTVDDVGPGLTCMDNPCLPESEPAGIAADGPSRLLVSDTNNHRIIEYRLDQGLSRTWMV